MDGLNSLTTALDLLEVETGLGRLARISGSTVRIEGLVREVQLGDRIEVQGRSDTIAGEVIALEKDHVLAALEGNAQGLKVGHGVRHLGRPTLRPTANWLGRVVDPDGCPLDGRPLLPGTTPANLDQDPLPANRRRGLGERLRTGYAVFNTLLPIVRGQRIGIFAGSGVGKSTLLAGLAQTIEVDIIVIALVGERGREVREFVEETLGPEAMSRTIVVAATSDRAPHVRRRCAQSATAIAETFRDLGHHVLLLVDSLTRFCEAHREISISAGETANLRGHPASTAPAIAHLCERAGPGTGSDGDITAIYTVLVAGSDMEEPVADMVRGVLDGHLVLSRDIAERGRFPAVDVVKSVSRSLPKAASRIENEIIKKTRNALAIYAESVLMIRAGLYQKGSDTELDVAVSINEDLETFLSQRNKQTIAEHFERLKKITDQKK